MNISAMLNNTVNVSMDMMMNDRYCEVLEMNLDYNLYIVANFVYFMAFFLEMKRGFLSKIEKETGINLKYILLISMLVFNVCMLLFQFLLKPIEIMVGG